MGSGSDSYSEGGILRSLSTKKISVAAAVTTEIAPKNGKKTPYIHSYQLCFEGTQQVKFQAVPASGSTTDLTGDMQFKADGILENVTGKAPIKGKAGEALSLVTAQSVAVEGWINFFYE